MTAPRLHLLAHPAGDLAALAALERRLDAGYRKIEDALARGEDVTAWEDFWIDLLHQYEAECDAIHPRDGRMTP